MFKDMELPAAGAARRDHLLQELAAIPKWLAAKPRHDDYGELRCETVPHKKRKTLEEGQLRRRAHDVHVFVTRRASEMTRRPGSAK